MVPPGFLVVPYDRGLPSVASIAHEAVRVHQVLWLGLRIEQFLDRLKVDGIHLGEV